MIIKFNLFITMIIQKNNQETIIILCDDDSYIIKYNNFNENKFDENLKIYKNKEIFMLLEDNACIEYRYDEKKYYYKNKIMRDELFYGSLIYLKNAKILTYVKISNILAIIIINLENMEEQMFQIDLSNIINYPFDNTKVKIIEYDYCKLAIYLTKQSDKSKNIIYLMNLDEYTIEKNPILKFHKVIAIDTSCLEKMYIKDESVSEMIFMNNNKIVVIYENNICGIYNCDSLNKILEFESVIEFGKNVLYENGNLIDVIEFSMKDDSKINDGVIKINRKINVISIVLCDIHKINNYDMNFFYKN